MPSWRNSYWRARQVHHLYPGLTTEQAAQIIALEAETLAPQQHTLVPRWQVWPAADLHCFYARHLKASPPAVLKAETVLELREQVLASRAGIAGVRGNAAALADIEALEFTRADVGADDLHNLPMRRGQRQTTNDPLPCRRLISPSATRASRAFRTVPLLRPCCCTKVVSLGITLPRGYTPAEMSPRRMSASCCQSGVSASKSIVTGSP